MPTFPYQPFNWSDYFADTSQLKTLEHGAYLLLIAAYWQHKGPLSAAPERLAAAAKLSPAQWRKVEPSIRPFFTERDGCWHHKRIDEDLGKVRAKIEQNARAGRASGAARSSPNPTGVERTLNGRSDFVRTDGQPRAYDSCSSLESSSEKQETLTKQISDFAPAPHTLPSRETNEPAKSIQPTSTTPSDFQKFVAAYPEEGREREQLCEGYYFQIVTDTRFGKRATGEEVMAGLARWKLSHRWHNGNVHGMCNFLKEGLFREHPQSQAEWEAKHHKNGKPPPEDEAVTLARLTAMADKMEKEKKRA